MKKSLLVLLLLLFFPLDAKTVVILPFFGCSTQSLFFDAQSPFFYLRQALERSGYEVRYALDEPAFDEVVAIISLTRIERAILDQMAAYPKEKRLLFCFEPPVVMPYLYHNYYTGFFEKIFVLFDHLVSQHNYHKFYYPQPSLALINPIPPFEKKKLSCLINNNKEFPHPQSLYGERRNIIAFFETLPKGEFDLYGANCNGCRDWKGRAPPNKWETLKDYKFCICYENMHTQLGYITEKIFDVLISGCVPVYWGASNVTDYIAEKCFIDRRLFSSDEELYCFLKTMDRSTYERYQEAIKHFLASPQAALFSVENFVRLILSEIKK